MAKVIQHGSSDNSSIDITTVIVKNDPDALDLFGIKNSPKEDKNKTMESKKEEKTSSKEMEMKEKTFTTESEMEDKNLDMDMKMKDKEIEMENKEKINTKEMEDREETMKEQAKTTTETETTTGTMKETSKTIFGEKMEEKKMLPDKSEFSQSVETKSEDLFAVDRFEPTTSHKANGEDGNISVENQGNFYNCIIIVKLRIIKNITTIASLMTICSWLQGQGWYYLIGVELIITSELYAKATRVSC